MKLNKQIFGWLGASALLLTACTANDGYDQPQGEVVAHGEVYGSGSQLINFTIDAQKLEMGSRAIDYTRQNAKISDGSLADILVFEVWETTNPTDANPDYTISYDFYKEYTGKYSSTGSGTPKFVQNKGQNVIDLDEKTTWPIKITLATDPNKYYKVAFWAQSGMYDGYTINGSADPAEGQAAGSYEGLTNVMVKVLNVKNNQEICDAFCATSPMFSGNSKSTYEIILKRPFAQINVGTSGADYRNFMENDNIYPNGALAFSKVTISGVANSIDILHDKIGPAMDDDLVLEYNKFPAYTTKVTTVPTGDYKRLYSEGEDFLQVKLNKNPTSADVFAKYVTNWTKTEQENPFFITYDENSGYLGYKTHYPTMIDLKAGEEGEGSAAYSAYLTETFKYLSMSYVLIPNNQGTVTVKLEMAENPDGSDGHAYFTLWTVPAQRNWRTNILGGLAWMKDPNFPSKDPDDPDPDDPEPGPGPGYPDPEDPDDPTPGPTPPDGPDDPTTIFNVVKLCIHLDPLYNQEQNGMPSYDEEDEKTYWEEINKNTYPENPDNTHPATPAQ